MKLFALLCLAASALGSDVTVSWEPHPDNRIARYEVHYGQSPVAARHYSRTNSVTRTNLSLRLTNLADGFWYFSVAGVYSNGVRSYYSSEVAWRNDGYQPPGVGSVSSSRATIH